MRPVSLRLEHCVEESNQLALSECVRGYAIVRTYSLKFSSNVILEYVHMQPVASAKTNLTPPSTRVDRCAFNLAESALGYSRSAGRDVRSLG